MGSRWVLGAAAVFGAGIGIGLAPPGVAAPAPSRGPLLLTSFLQRGRTDVRRNEILEFRFSVPLRKGSVDLRTLQVNELTPAGAKPAVGARIVVGNTVRFSPRRTQRNYDEAQRPNSIVTGEDHVLGFSGGATYEVRLRSGSVIRSLRGRQGQRLARAFVATFRTNDLYDDPVEGQPSFSGVLGFSPPRHSSNGLVDDGAAIVLDFSEPILASSMRLGDTVLVTRTSSGEAVPGALSADPVANSSRFLFVPEGGWNAAAAGQWGDVHVALTTGITDLAGNPLKRPFGMP